MVGWCSMGTFNDPCIVDHVPFISQLILSISPSYPTIFGCWTLLTRTSVTHRRTWVDGIAERGSTAAAEWQCWDRCQLMAVYYRYAVIFRNVCCWFKPYSNHLRWKWAVETSKNVQWLYNQNLGVSLAKMFLSQPFCLGMLVLFPGWFCCTLGFAVWSLESGLRSLDFKTLWCCPYGSWCAQCPTR